MKDRLDVERRLWLRRENERRRNERRNIHVPIKVDIRIGERRKGDRRATERRDDNERRSR